jgi:hypothetical protein
MPATGWLSGTLAAAMLAVAAYCAGRLAAAAAWRRDSELDADAMHLVMGVAMAGMLARSVSVGPPGAWQAVFALTGAWFAWQAARAWRGRQPGRGRCPYPLPHLAESLAMIYMLAGGTAMPGMGMGGPAAGPGSPVLGVIFALFMLGYAAWLGDRLRTAASAGPGGALGATAPAVPGGAVAAPPRAASRRPVLAPRAAVCYKIVMSVAMAYMLIVMV